MALEFEKEQEQQVVLEIKDHEDEEPKKYDVQLPREDANENDAAGQLNLFGEVESTSEPKNKKKKSKSPKKSVSKTDTNKTYSVDYTVYYAGHAIQVPEDGMTLEAIRQYLETDFPELSKERTTFDVDEEKKHLYARVSGAKKG